AKHALTDDDIKALIVTAGTRQPATDIPPILAVPTRQCALRRTCCANAAGCELAQRASPAPASASRARSPPVTIPWYGATIRRALGRRSSSLGGLGASAAARRLLVLPGRLFRAGPAGRTRDARGRLRRRARVARPRCARP